MSQFFQKVAHAGLVTLLVLSAAAAASMLNLGIEALSCAIGRWKGRRG